MVSKTTKAIASRIPVDLYFQLKNEADALEMNMNDYLIKIITARHEKTEVIIKSDPQLVPVPEQKAEPVKEKKEKKEAPKPKPKKVKTPPPTGMGEILFPDMD